MAFEDAFLAIEWQVIGILVGNHVSHQPWPGEPLLDRLGKPLGDHDVGGAVGTGVFRADVLEHDQRRGDVFELFADFGADALPHSAAVGARELFGEDVMHHRLAGQARGQGLPAVTLLLGLGRTRRRRRFGDHLGLRRGLGLGFGLRQDFLGEEPELSGVDALALAAVALTEEFFELMLELGVEMKLLGERVQQLADELMGRLDVVGEWISQGDHTLYYVDAYSFVGAICSEFWRDVRGRV